MSSKPQAVSAWKVVLALLLILASAGACKAGRATERPPAGGTGPIATASHVPAQTGTLLFRDDFQDGKTQEWTVNGAWNVEQNGEVYRFATSALGAAWVTNGGGWKDYTYQSAFRVDTGALFISINLGQSGRYGLRLGGDDVYVVEEQPAGTANLLGEAGPITTGSWHRVSFASQRGHVQVSIDQVVWFDMSDSTPVTQGTIAVSALQGSRVAVDNVLVTTTQGTLPAAVPHAPAPTQPVQAEEIQAELGVLPLGGAEVEVGEEPTPPPPIVGGKPDLVLEDVSFTPDPIVQGQPFTANFLLANRGDAAAGAFTSGLHFHAAAGIADCNMDVSGLAPGEVAWGSCTRTINGNPGAYPIEVTADVEGEIAESDEGNNMITSAVTVAAPPHDAGLPDLTVTSIAFRELDPQAGPLYTCNISNVGDADSPMVTVEVLDHGGVIFTTHIAGIPKGRSLGASFAVHGESPHVLTCIADADMTIPESNEDNNTLTATFQ